MKATITLLFATLFTCLSSAQQHYAFFKISPGTHAYEELSNPVQVSAFSSAGLYTLGELDGETFRFFGQDYTFGNGQHFISVGEGGFMRLDNDSSLIILDVGFTYLDTIDSTSGTSYSIDGPPGSRILKTQYKNYRLRYGNPDNYANFQTWYYQASGIIEFRYGARSASNVSGYTTVNGPNTGLFFSPHDFSHCYEKLWVKGNPNNPTLDSATNYVFHAMNGLPDSGTVFRFIPVEVLGMGESVPKQPVKIYPNPTGGKIRIETPASGTLRIGLYDTTGKLILESLNKREIDLVTLEPGVYVLKVSGDDGFDSVHRVIRN